MLLSILLGLNFLITWLITKTCKRKRPNYGRRVNINGCGSLNAVIN